MLLISHLHSSNMHDLYVPLVEARIHTYTIIVYGIRHPSIRSSVYSSLRDDLLELGLILYVCAIIGSDLVSRFVMLLRLL